MANGFPQVFEIAGRKIGTGTPPFVIAEAGINHEGSFEKAIALVDAAKEAGADCIKFQCHITDKEMIPTDMKPGKISDERLWDIIKRCELTEAEERKVMDYCAQKGILYLSTPFSREAADRLESFGVPAYKIGSGECNNYPLISHIAKFGKPILLSTGMNSIESVRPSVEIIRKAGCPLLLMHCVSMYPTPYEEVRLGAMEHLAREFGVPVGLSDHSIGIYTALGAVALGASALEKHFTVTREWPGPDVPISINPAELKDLVIGSRAIQKAMGGSKSILAGEQPVIDFAYACVVSIRGIRKGEVMSHDNVWVKRPGTGPLKAIDFEKVLGKKAKHDIPDNAQLKWEDLE